MYRAPITDDTLAKDSYGHFFEILRLDHYIADSSFTTLILTPGPTQVTSLTLIWLSSVQLRHRSSGKIGSGPETQYNDGDQISNTQLHYPASNSRTQRTTSYEPHQKSHPLESLPHLLNSGQTTCTSPTISITTCDNTTSHHPPDPSTSANQPTIGTLTCSSCTGTAHTQCQKCIGLFCERCGGSGTFECCKCDGHGTVTCEDCDGVGSVARVEGTKENRLAVVVSGQAGGGKGSLAVGRGAGGLMGGL